jgi:hypothetical protein
MNLKHEPLPETMDTKHLLHNGEYHTLFMFLEVYSSFNMFLVHPHVVVGCILVGFKIIPRNTMFQVRSNQVLSLSINVVKHSYLIPCFDSHVTKKLP